MKKTTRIIAFCLAMLSIAFLVWWITQVPSNNRDWQTDVAVLPYATIKNNEVTVHHIRDFVYHTELDYLPRYYDRAFDLNHLTSVDLVAVYWMGPSIAHTFLSFGFDDKDYLAISIEIRKEKSESYSSLKGFFRQYELYYVAASERDLIKLRTNYRKNPPEAVYLYRIKGSQEKAKKVFLEYIHKMNQLKARPEFYNTLTTNCTTNMWVNSLVNADHLPFSWKILASGYLPKYLYEQGWLDSHGLSFSELQRQSNINHRAQAADEAANFSALIRKN